MDRAERNGSALRRRLRCAERLSEAAIRFGSRQVNTPLLRSSASLSRVTRCDQRRAVLAILRAPRRHAFELFALVVRQLLEARQQIAKLLRHFELENVAIGFGHFLAELELHLEVQPPGKAGPTVHGPAPGAELCRLGERNDGDLAPLGVDELHAPLLGIDTEQARAA